MSIGRQIVDGDRKPLHWLLGRLALQPWNGIMTVGFAGAAIVAAWLAGDGYNLSSDTFPTTVLTLCLVTAYILSYAFPIHVRRHTKVQMGTVPLYLMAALLPVPLAAIAACLTVFTAEMSRRSEFGTHMGDFLTNAGRYAVVVLAGSVVAHISLPGQLHPVPWLLAAVAMWSADFLTLPILFAPVLQGKQSPLRLVRASIKQAGPIEAAQYVVGVLGLVAALQERWALALLLLPIALVYHAFKSALEMSQGTRSILENIADTVDLRDPSTGGHSRRVAELVAGMMKELRVRGPEAELIVSSARVHDIGKVAIPDYLLNKPGSFTPEERLLMQSHVERGAEYLERYPDFARGVAIVRHHHESWDGSGYPHRLKGDDIPFGSRVIAVVDSYDAMTMERPYQRTMSPEEAVDVLREGRGRQWDPAVVDAFLRSIADRLGEGRPVLRVVEGAAG